MPKNKWGVNSKGWDVAQSSQAKRKKTMAIELFGEALPKHKRSNTSNNQDFKFLSKQYSFKMSQSFIYSIRVTSSSYPKFGAPMKLDVQMTPTIVSSTGWFIILPANALSLRIKFKYWSMLVLCS